MLVHYVIQLDLIALILFSDKLIDILLYNKLADGDVRKIMVRGDLR